MEIAISFYEEIFHFYDTDKQIVEIVENIIYKGFWMYYFRLENSTLKWPMSQDEAFKINKKELKWLLKLELSLNLSHLKEETAFKVNIDINP